MNLAVALVLVLLADIVTLKNGEKYEGKVTKKGNLVVIETAKGVVEVEADDVAGIESKPWTPPAPPKKEAQDASRKIAGWPDVQPAPKNPLRQVYRDPFINFRILFPDGWRFEATEQRTRFDGRGARGESIEVRVDKADVDFKSFLSEQNKNLKKIDSETEIKVGGLPAWRGVATDSKKLLKIVIDAGERKFTLSYAAAPDDFDKSLEEVEAVLRSIRIFPENPYSDEKKQKYDELYENAVNEMNARNFPAAIKVLEQWRDVVPNYPEAHKLIHTACTYIVAEYKRGADALQKAAKLDPDNFEYRFYLSQIFLSLKKFSDSEKEALEAVKLEPWREPAWTQLGTACLYTKNLKKAKEALRRALEINPKAVPATYNLGVVFESEGKIDDAETAYQATLKLQPDHADAKAGLDRLAKARKK